MNKDHARHALLNYLKKIRDSAEYDIERVEQGVSDIAVHQIVNDALMALRYVTEWTTIVSLEK